jgi:hypothetical protein
MSVLLPKDLPVFLNGEVVTLGEKEYLVADNYLNYSVYVRLTPLEGGKDIAVCRSEPTLNS